MAHRITTDQIAHALTQAQGYVYVAAKSLNCNAKTIYRRIDKSTALKDLLEELRGHELDIAELKLREAVVNGERWAIMFKLRTLGKDRGYYEKKDITSGDQPISDPITIFIPDNGRE